MSEDKDILGEVVGIEVYDISKGWIIPEVELPCDLGVALFHAHKHQCWRVFTVDGEVINSVETPMSTTHAAWKACKKINYK